jgi:hypothetical protein
MAIADHLARYRMKSTEDLLAMQTALEAEETVYAQQSQGNTNMTRDLRLLTEKLNAIAYVLRERSGVPVGRSPQDQSVGQTDFSCVQ